MQTRPTILVVALITCVVLILLFALHSPITAAQPSAAVSSWASVESNVPQVHVDGAAPIIISGHVVNGRAGLSVQVLRPDGRAVDETRTSAGGQFRFPPFPARHYRLLLLDEQGQPLKLEADVDVWPEQAGNPIELTLVLIPPAPEQVEYVLDKPFVEVKSDRISIVQANGFITGVITAADTGLPEDALFVKVYDTAGVLRKTAFPDFFTAVYSASVPPGAYRVKFEPYGGSSYAPEWYDNQRDFASAASVVVNDSAVTPNINAELEVGGRIAGQVTAATGGAPLNNAAVYAYTSTTSINYVANDTTTSSGLYTITGLVTGTYYLKFDPAFGSDYLAEYYNNKPSLATADGVPVMLGGVTSGIDAALETGGKITGQVTAAAGGAPLNDVSVYAYTSTTAVNYVAYAYTNASGAYTLTKLTAGNFYLKFDPPFGSDYLEEYYNNKPTLASADAIPVTLGSVASGINAALETGGKITGQVTGAGGTPIEDVYVEAYTSTTSFSAVAYEYTTASGRYTLTNLGAGNYYLKFNPPYGSDYLEEYYNDKPSLGSADAIPVALGSVVGGIDANLSQGGKITGRVTGFGGAPLESVFVLAYTSTTSTSYAAYDWTDASGIYTITNLTAGNYYLEFNPPGLDYFVEYYNNKPSLASADAIPVAFGSVVSGIDAALDIGGKITGQVTGIGGVPLQNIAVHAYTSTTSIVPVATDFTDASGVYTMTGLTTRNYYLQFDPPFNSDYFEEYYDNKSSLAAADAIPVALNTVVSNINASLPLASKITGRVTASDGGAPLKDVNVIVYGYDECNNQVSIGSATTNASGVYTVTRLLAGSYRVRFSPSSFGASAAYLGEYYNDKPTLETADTVNVAAGSVTSGIDAVLQRSGQMTGRVTAADGGSPLSGVSVIAYNTNGSFVESDSTDATGVYTITGLTTGSYRLRFDPSSGTSLPYLGEYYNNKSSLATADPITVTLGSVRESVDAVLDRGAQITGRVTAADGGAPLQFVSVYIYNSNGSFVDSTSTNANGVYTTTGLASGSYRLRFRTQFASGTAANYVDEYYNDKSTLPTADPIPVTIPNIASGIDAVLIRGGQITGTVTAADTGGPLIGVEVDAYNSNGVEVRYDYTDSAGNYVLPGLPTGTYRVRFRSTTVSIVNGCSVTQKTYTEEYYNDKPTLATADGVPVTAPNTTSGINAALGVGSITGSLDKKIYLPVILR
jgi:hypothetical protein